VGRIYVDNAATSWPKPEAVYTAIDRYLRECGAPAGRSAYSDAVDAARAVNHARNLVAKLLSVGDPRRVVFTLNGTDALNIAIHGVVEPQDHVVTTEAEHNSVLRPLRFLEDTQHVEVSRVPCDRTGLVNPSDIRAALRPNTKLVAVTHASNVTGTIQPIEEIGAAVRQHGALLLVDAAQSVGHIPIALDDLAIDLLAAPGHKGLLGPLGTGVLIVGARAEPLISTFRQGGTGTDSQDDRHPRNLPELLEAGNPNVGGIMGLAAGVEFLLDTSIAEIQHTETRLTQHLINGLEQIGGVTIHGTAADSRVGVVSISIADYDAQEVAAALDSGYGIQVRAGLHCAPLIHKQLETERDGGTVRFSIGPFNTEDDIRQILSAVQEIALASVEA
jgi:cysteine desulfurase family protein